MNINRKEKNNFLAEVGLYGFGGVLARLIGVATTAVLARLLTTGQFGQLDFLLGIIALIVTSFSLQTENALLRLYHVAEVKEKSNLLGTHLVFSTIVGVCSPALLIIFKLFFGSFLAQNIPDINVGWISPLFLSGLWFNHVLALLRTSRKASTAIVFSCGVTLLQLLLTFPLAYFYGVGGVLLARATAELFGSLVVMFENKADYRLGISGYWLRRSIRYGAPLLPEVMAQGIVGNVSRYALISSLGAVSVGIFAVGVKISLILGVFVGAFKTAWLPHAFSLQKEKSESGSYQSIDSVYIKSYFRIMFLLSMIVMVFSKDIITVVVSSRYVDAAPIVGILCVSTMLQGLVVVMKTPFMVSEQTVKVMITSFITIFLSSALAFVAVPRWGIMAAAIVNMLSYVFLLCVLYVQLPNRVKFRWIMLSAFAVSSVITFGCIYVMPWFVDLSFFVRFGFGSVIIFVAFFLLQQERHWVAEIISEKFSI